MQYQHVLLLLFFCSTLFSCSNKELFTQAYRNRINESKRMKVEQVQYYTDRDIRLVYSSKIADESISGGKVEFKDGYYVYTISIKRMTPGIAEVYNSSGLKIYFEEGHYLVFRNFRGDTHYQLAGEMRNGIFQVNYEGKWFTPEEGGEARLLFVKNRIFEHKEEERQVKGMRVGAN